MTNAYKVKLLKKVLRGLKSEKKSLFVSGLCHFVWELYVYDYITFEQCDNFGEILERNKPKGMWDDDYYFKPGLVKPRIKYLNQLIKKYGVKK